VAAVVVLAVPGDVFRAILCDDCRRSWCWPDGYGTMYRDAVSCVGCESVEMLVLLSSGDALTVFELGSVCYTLVILVVNVRISMAMHFHHWFFQLAVAGSTASWIIAALVFEAFNANGIRGGIHRMLSSASFWVRTPFAAVCFFLSYCFVRHWNSSPVCVYSSSCCQLRLPWHCFTKL
jgi:hypothetical protein